jgi:hypothetical protein
LNGALTAWVSAIDEPSPLGWITTAGYILAGLLCLRAALIRQYAGAGEPSVWRAFAGMLIFLGINKQLDFQTLLIVIGRAAARTEGWYGERRLFQKVFVCVLVLVLMGAVCRAVSRHGFFIRNHRLASTGLGLVLIYALLRAAEIDHLEPGHSARPAGQFRLWIVEVTGIILCIIGAARGGRSFVPATRGISNDAVR